MDWIKKNWKFLAVVAAAVLILAVVIVVVMPGQSSDPVIDNPRPDEGPETGVYYYDTAEGEYLLTLNSGDSFTIAGPSLNKSGKYVVTETGIELDFVKDEDGTGSLKDEDGVLTLQYKDKTMRFLRKETYAVSFQVNGGSAVDTVDVLNGKTVQKPADPVKAGSVFIGWYADEACTELYPFGSQIITANTTVYAKWAEPVVGQNEYTVKFDLGYEAEGYAAMSTIGGKLFNVPTPEREGYTFGGWWISMVGEAEKLTYAYHDEMVFQANTTLFALWTTAPEGGKLESPMVEVIGDTISWNTVKGASTYALKIMNAAGDVIHNVNVGTNYETYKFSELTAGEYTVEVTAQASVSEKNSDPTVRNYVNKALNRVSLFTVVDGGVLLWNGVEGAEKYLITVKCGDHEHKHTALDNGRSTTYFFGGCAMQPGGIEFTVTAEAEGMSSSVSETFVYERHLDAVGEIVYDAESQSFYWSAVQDAAKYMISVNGDTVFIDNGSATTFSVKHLSGEITVAVIPVTNGYNSPEATTATCTKTSLAAPQGVSFSGNTMNWEAVDGAESYMVKINGQTFPAENNSLDLSDLLEWTSETTYEISVMAVGTENSLYSDEITIKYLTAIDKVTYQNNTVTWTPILGVSNYEVKVNGGNAVKVTGQNYTTVKLTKAGVNTIEVRYSDLGGGQWTKIEVYAYAVSYDSRSIENGIITEYLAMGDSMMLPSNLEQPGYQFTGWYNTPDAATANGEAYVGDQFNGYGSLVLYGNWTPKTFNVTFKGITDAVINIKEDEVQGVVYKTGYKLPVPESATPGDLGDFAGWYTLPGGNGTALTDANGNCLANYSFTRDTTAYPYFDNGVLNYVIQADGTYGVTAGPTIKNVTNVRVPEYYKGIPVTIVMDNAFYGINTIEKLEIPATIKYIGVGAIPTGNQVLKEVNIYTDTVQTNYEVFYSSHDGALMRHDMGTVYLEYFPRGKTGEYIMSDDVQVIRDKAFRYSKITKLTIGNGVTEIMRQAFYECTSLQTLEFKGEGTAALTIDPEAFYKTTNITSIYLPARMTEVNHSIFNQFTKLATIEVEPGGTNFSSKNNMILNGVGDVIVYAPKAIKGEFEIPLGIREIGPNAFQGRNSLTKVIIPNYVDVIGASAFEGCTGITEVVINGGRSNDLLIDARAFAGCSKVTTVTVKGSSTAAPGIVTLGTSAFEGNTSLKNLTFEAGATVVIGDRAFATNGVLKNPVYADGSVIQSIGAEAYKGCVEITEAVIPANTTAVGSGAFSGCTELVDVTFQPGGQEITFGDSIFADCRKLTTINIPATMNSFNGSVFDGCDAIKTITIAEGNENFVTFNGALYSTGYEELLFYPRGLNGDLTELAPGLKKIGPTVFKGNGAIKTAFISKDIISIGDSAFADCYNLEAVEFEEGTTEMTIGASAFAGCTKLKTITLPDCTASIGDYAFDAAGLTAFTIPAGTTYLGHYALRSTKITSIEFPANLEFVGDGCFISCSSLTTVTFEPGGEKPLTLGTLDLDITVTANRKLGIFYGTKIKEITLDKRVTVIGNAAFSEQTTLTKVDVPSDGMLTHIGGYAFYKCSALTTFSFGGNLKTIGTYAFNSASKLTYVSFPNTLESIGASAFYSCSALTEVYFAPGGTAPLDLSANSIFSFASNLTKVTYPARVQYIYPDAHLNPVDKKLNNHFNTCSNLVSFEMEAGSTQYTVINNAIYELNMNGEPESLLYVAPAKTGEFTVPKTVRFVASGAFYNTKLSKIIFEDYEEGDENYGKPLLSIGVEGSGNYVIYGASNLTLLQLPSHLAVIGKYAFGGLSKSGVSVVFHEASHLRMIDDYAFTSAKFTEITLPVVDYIDTYAFKGCTAMTKINFPANSVLTDISSYMFDGCTALTSIRIPASVVEIDTYAFNGCTKLSEMVFEEGCKVARIDNYAFTKTGFVEFVMPESVEYLGSHLFANCTSLKTITLNSKIPYVDGSIGFGCTSLSAVNVPGSNPSLMSIDGVVYDSAQTTLCIYPQAKDPTGFKLPDTLIAIEQYGCASFPGTELELPEGLETINNYAFRDSKLKSIHFPKSLKTLGTHVFYATAGNLESVTFAEDCALTSIGTYAFNNQSKLEKIVLPDNLKTLAVYTFNGCTMLKEVVLPAAMESLPEGVFAKCPNIEKFVMQEGLKKIVGYAFTSNTSTNSGIKELYIPSTVTELGPYAFAYLYNLEKVTFAEGSKLTKLGYYAFLDCYNLKSITLPASLTTLSTTSQSKVSSGTTYKISISCVFMGCTNLQTVDMSACTGLKTIPAKTFANCTGLETLLLPPNLTTIGDYAFGDIHGNLYDWYVDLPISSLKEITIPASVTSIGAFAFENMESLEKVVFESGSKLTKLGEAELTSEKNLCNQYIFANNPKLTTVVLPDNLVTIGLGCFENTPVTNIEIPSTVTTIGEAAFKNCSEIVTLNLPQGLQSLGREAFYGCTKLEKADLYPDLEKLGALAFAHCVSLKNAYIPAGVSKLDGNPYAGCTGLTEFVLDQDNSEFVIDEKNGAMYDKTMYTLLYYPASLTAETFEFPDTTFEIGDGAFAGSQLKTMVIPDRIKKVPAEAFSRSALESITFHGGITYLGDHAFEGCTNLNNVAIFNKMTYLGNYAFAGCTSLSNFTFEDIASGATRYAIGQHFFDGCTSITELILPNLMTLTDEEYVHWSSLRRDRNASIPSYMFANTGLVDVVLPAWVTDTLTEGVFYGCKDMETFVFGASTLKSKSLGPKWFYGCSSLKEIDIPSGLDEPFVYNTDAGAIYLEHATFAYCTSLERVKFTDTSIRSGNRTFYGCTSLTTIECGNTGTSAGFALFYQDAFYGCTNLKSIPVASGQTFYGQVFGESGFEVLHLKGTETFKKAGSIFAGAKNLKEIYTNATTFTGLDANTFAHVDCEMTIYFYNITFADLVAKVGSDSWFTNADKKITFYFKDTMPEGVVIPA